MIARFKQRLARVRVGSFRYHMTTDVWDKQRIDSARACSFYWWYLPSSVVAYFVAGVLFALWSVCTYLVIRPVVWLFGFTPSTKDAKIEPGAWDWNGGYGYNPITKKRNLIAPQHWVAIALGLVAIVLLSAHGGVPWALILGSVSLVVAVVATIAGIGFLVTRRAVKDGWHRICPPLNVVEDAA